MQKLSTLENTLTGSVRRFLTKHFTTDQIRAGSFLCSLLTCLVDASVVTFSIFTPQFISRIGYNQLDINIIAGGMNAGMYLTVPGLGYLSDAHGPILMALIGIILCPGYLLAVCCYTHMLSSWVMAIAFFLIGMGVSAAYFCSLLTCARIFPERKGLGISMPVTCYGLSPIIFSYLFKLHYFKEPNGEQIDIAKVFMWLAVVYLISGLMNSVSSVVVTIEKEKLFSKQNEQQALLDSQDGQEEEHVYAATDNTSLITSEFIEPQTQKAKFRKFLNDPSMKLVYVVLFFLLGTEELFVSNMGSLTQIVGNDAPGVMADVSGQVMMFGIFSTMARWGSGALNDCFGTFKSTLWILLTAIGLCIVSHILIAFNFDVFSVISAFMGLSYGTSSSMFPTMVAGIWGVDMMGSTWGLFLSAPAFGTLLSGLFYAYEYDSYCAFKTKSFSQRVYCLTFPFAIFASLCCISGVVLMYCYRRYWRELK